MLIITIFAVIEFQMIRSKAETSRCTCIVQVTRFMQSFDCFNRIITDNLAVEIELDVMGSS